MMRVLELVCCLIVVALSTAVAADTFRPADFQTRATFELVVDRSKHLKRGTSEITARSAFVSFAHGLIPGNSDGLEVLFFDKHISESDLPDLMNNDAKRMRRSASYAALVLFLDKEERVWQVNLSYVVPGITVARTVAWRPDELQRYFSQASLKDGRVAIKSNGSYSEGEPSQDAITLSWNVDLDLPVSRVVQR